MPPFIWPGQGWLWSPEKLCQGVPQVSNYMHVLGCELTFLVLRVCEQLLEINKSIVQKCPLHAPPSGVTMVLLVFEAKLHSLHMSMALMRAS